MELRSSQQQLSDAFLDDYKRMTDPEERKKAVIKKRREEFSLNMSADAGL